MLYTGKLETRADLLNFMRSHPLPATLEEMEDLKTYAVDGIADIWNMFKEPDGSVVCAITFERIPLHSIALCRIKTHTYAFCCLLLHFQTLAVPLISKKCIGWIRQLLKVSHAWALHGDGKHKLHIGGWPLITWGTHCLKWDVESKCYRHSYRPLIYLFSKNVETKSAGRLAMVALQLASVHFFGKRLQSAVNISDCSPGLMAGMQYLNIDHTKPEEEESWTPHQSDWAHMYFHYGQGGAHAHALIRTVIRLRSLAFACIFTHSYACICILRKAPAQDQPLLWRGLALLEGHPLCALDGDEESAC